VDVGASWALNVDGVAIRTVVTFVIRVLTEESSSKALVPHELAWVNLLAALTSVDVRIYRLQDVGQLINVVQVRDVTQVWGLRLLIYLDRLSVDVESQCSLQTRALGLGCLCVLVMVVARYWVVVGVIVDQVFFVLSAHINIDIIVIITTVRVLDAVLLKISLLIRTEFVLGCLVWGLMMLLPNSPIR
jgi:hypothetical protein